MSEVVARNCLIGLACVELEVVKGGADSVPGRLACFGVACEKTIETTPVRSGLADSGARSSAPEFEVTWRLAVGSDGRGFCGGTERDFDATDKAGADRRRTFGLARLEPTRVLGAMRFEGDEVLARGVADGARGGCNDGSKM